MYFIILVSITNLVRIILAKILTDHLDNLFFLSGFIYHLIEL
jgi:hypothetical protein